MVIELVSDPWMLEFSLYYYAADKTLFLLSRMHLYNQKYQNFPIQKHDNACSVKCKKVGKSSHFLNDKNNRNLSLIKTCYKLYFTSYNVHARII